MLDAGALFTSDDWWTRADSSQFAVVCLLCYCFALIQFRLRGVCCCPDGARHIEPQRANGGIFLEGFVRIWLKERLT